MSLHLPTDKIVGGHFAEEHQFPYQIALFNGEKFRCGGSFIDAQWVLTAAHCVLDGSVKIPPSNLTVFAGSSNLDGDGHYFEVEDTFAHEQYGAFMNDIALMKLKSPAEFDEGVQKINLFDGELEEHSKVTISGFGRVGTGLPTSNQLKFNTMYALRDWSCYASTGIVYEGLVCFNSAVDNGACNGDSGGPAVYNGQLVGVANFVVDGCGSLNPDGYAKVSYFVDWIKDTMNRH